jgi:hypothetical protein
MQMLKHVWQYFGQTQPAFVRVLHLIILIGCVSQLITSNLVDLQNARLAGGSIAFGFGTWTHILPGLLLVVIAALFIAAELLRRGPKYFYPYLWGELSQLKADLKTLAGRRLPDAAPGGLAAIVQGLGLGALGLTLLSGLMWFLLVQRGSGLAHVAIEMHEALTGLVIAYLIGHGGMGVLHIFLWMRSNAKTTAGGAPR